MTDTVQSVVAHASSHGSSHPSSHVWHWRFWCFLGAQFLGAFNDNAFKLVISMAALAMFSDPQVKNSYVALASALAILPFILFASYAAYCADRYNKRRVLIISKAAEIPAMLTALLLLWSGGGITPLMFVLFLMATQSAFFGPVKYGFLPEAMPPAQLTKANGLLNMLTYLAIIAGTVAGGAMWQHLQDTPVVIGLLLVGIAAVGTVLILFTPATARPDHGKRFHLNPLHEPLQVLPLIRGNRVLFWAVVGSAAFWMLGGLLYQCLIVLGREVLHVSETASGALFACLAVGIGIGSVISGARATARIPVEQTVWGLVLIGGGAIFTYTAIPSYYGVAVLMGVIGLGGGLFVVPLSTLLQKESPPERRGQVIAASAALDMAGVLLASGMFWLFNAQMGLAPQDSILILGGLAVVALGLVLVRAPRLAIRALRPLGVVVLRIMYRVRIDGPGAVNGRFPAVPPGTILTPNHVSLVDGFLIILFAPEVRFLVHSRYWKKPLSRWTLEGIRAIPFSDAMRDVRHGLEAARMALAAGESLCVFPEGAVTRTGHQHAFRRGIEKLAEGLSVTFLPLHLDGLWGSFFSFHGGGFFRARPGLCYLGLRRPVRISVGDTLPGTTPAWQVGRAVASLGCQAVAARFAANDTLGRATLAALKGRQLFRVTMSDTTGARLNGLKTLVGARLVARWLARRVADDEQAVGVLLPAGVGGGLANLALALSGRAAVNLNFSLGFAIADATARQANLQTIITSRKFLQKLEWQADPRMVFLEDMRTGVTQAARLTALLQAVLLPMRGLAWLWLSGDQRVDATAAILFSSGTTAEPKGVMLSHRAVRADVSMVTEILRHAERAAGRVLPLASALPQFHSFGYTVCLWFPLLDRRRVAWHVSPLDAKTVVKMVKTEDAGILLATPTFAQTYVRNARDGELSRLHLLVLGGEKLTAGVGTTLRDSLPGCHVLQGYGCTELGPVVAVNVPDVVEGGRTWRGNRPESVGLPLAGVVVEARSEDGTPLPPESEGGLFIQSPAMMQGYLNTPVLTAQVMGDGWYATGDIGRIDSEGFIHITDRAARFSKIGGEMVPHGKIEAVVDDLLGDRASIVVSLPDEKKGERLGLLYVKDGLEAAELHGRLLDSGLPALWIPRREAMARIAELPLTPTGKVDLRAAKKILLELLGG
jgi:acyl-[acyl-carrier-protein]-phospholipid O-acyltransferase/long-chain-fatty-acid--[acyl-carrier-protein] ligase